MSNFIKQATLAVVAAGACVSAQAGIQLRLDGFTVPNAKTVEVSVTTPSSASYTGAAGQFSGLLGGTSFQTYCTDLLQSVSFNKTYTYSLVDGVAAWGATKADDLGRLLTYVNLTPQWASESAMIQSAVWEILYESSRDYSFTSGNIRIGAGGDTGSWLAGFDWTAMKNTTSMYDVDQLYSSTSQDFLTATRIAQPVPEPSTYALLLAGLGAVGVAARRRAAAAST